MDAQEKLELVDRILKHLRNIQLLGDEIHDEFSPEEEGLEKLVNLIVDIDIAVEDAIHYCEAF